MNAKIFIPLSLLFTLLSGTLWGQEKQTPSQNAKDTIPSSRSLRRLLLEYSDRISRKYKYNATLDK